MKLRITRTDSNRTARLKLIVLLLPMLLIWTAQSFLAGLILFFEDVPEQIRDAWNHQPF